MFQPVCKNFRPAGSRATPYFWQSEEEEEKEEVCRSRSGRGEEKQTYTSIIYREFGKISCRDPKFRPLAPAAF